MKDRHTWGEWHEWCRRYYQRWENAPLPAEPVFLAPPGVDRETYRRNADWLDRSQWPRCQRIIEDLASNGRWPSVPEELQWLLAQRLGYAMEILSLLKFGKCPLPRPAPEPGAKIEIIRWLLLDAWFMGGHNRWLDRFVARSDVNG